MTAEQFLRANIKERCELIEGCVYILPYRHFGAGTTITRLLLLLDRHVRDEDTVVLGPGIGFLIARNPDTLRAPAIALVSDDSLINAERDDFIDGPPLFAVEVPNCDERAEDIHERASAWLNAGCPMAWIVDPWKRIVTVMLQNEKAKVLKNSDMLDGGDVLPGFKIDVSQIFAF
jgi:Uma2 family endonuclease